MGILNNLLWPIWQAEEQGKSRKYHERLNALSVRLAARYLNRATPLQKKIKRWGGATDPNAEDARSMQGFYNTQLIQRAQAHAASITGMQAAASNQINRGYGGPVVLGGAGSAIGGSAGGSGGGWLTLGGVKRSWPWSRALFEVLRGIEERADKGRLHRYDDDACNMMDYRLIEKEVPLIWIASFCLANHQDPEMMVLLIEHSGYTVVEGDGV